MLPNEYGRFTDDGRAYEITNPRTPRPWVNVVSNGRYGFVVSGNGGGFSWLDHCQLNVLTRWEMDHLRDDRGRFLYLSDLDDGSVWSLAPHPCRPAYDAFRCVHRAGGTTFESSCLGMLAVWEMGVSPVENAELWEVALTNQSDRPRRLRLGAFFQWCCGTAPDTKREFHRLFFTTRHDAKRRAIIATKNMWEAPFGTPDDHWNRPWPSVAGFAMSGGSEGGGDRAWATSDTEAFLGRDGDQTRPAGMIGGCEPVFGRFGDACAAMGADLVLQPGETVTRSFVLAVADDDAGLLGLLDRFSTTGAVRTALDESAAGWRERLAPTRVASDAPDFDLLNNHWLPYQAISARLWARTGYYQQSGAFGFRDQLQDSQVWLHREPGRCRDQILLHAAHQFADGSVYHWWNPLTETGLHDNCSDDYLWLPFVVSSYIRETGDTAVLDERVRFVDDEGGATLADHCKRSIARSLSRRSARGLPLIGDNDWNDGLSAVGQGDKGESVWVALFLMTILEDFTRALELHGDGSSSARYAAERENLRRAVAEHAWDGAWYRRATDRDGRWLGSKESLEGKIFLNAQAWAIFAAAGDEGRLNAAWESAKEHLLTPYGPLLLAPAYTVPDAKIGYLSRYAPGSRENGGVYMHAATWALKAACVRKDAEAVASIWNSISPPTRAADADAYAAEPYVLPGNVDGPLSSHPGRAGWTWYTGSAAWLNFISLEWVAGARADWDALLIDPCPMPGLGAVEVVRRWRGREVVIRFDAAGYDAGAECVVELNGAVVAGGRITEAMLPEGGAEAGAAGGAAGGRCEVSVRWARRETPMPEVLVKSRQGSQT